ncbi:MAG: hypothetical protein WC840_02405 [Candidatus Peribacteraceae bacterium]
MHPEEPTPLKSTVIAEIHRREGGIIGLVKIGNRQVPLIFESVPSDEEQPPRVHTLWRLLQYLNKRIRQASCLDDLSGESHTVSLPLNHETLDVLHRVISFVGAGRVTVKWLLTDASRDKRILRIPREPDERT